MKNIVIVRKLPSNLIEEAILVIKDKNKKIDKDIKHNIINDEDFLKIKNIPKENSKYIIKEAEMVICDYLDKIDENAKYKDRLKFKKTYKKMKYANFVLLVISILSTMICICK